MRERHLLYLSSQQLTAQSWKGGRFGEASSFPCSEAGVEAFRQYLESRRNEIFYLLVNVGDEGFQLETVPFLQGRDRDAIIKRKLGQYFYSTNLAMALRLGYEKNRRKDERLLLAGFTNPQLIIPWTQALQSLGIALAGIYSLPLISTQLLKQLSPGNEPCLMLTIQDHSLRQSFFDKGELHFSRLANLHDSSIHGIGHALASEAHKMSQYLAGQRLIGRGQPLRVLALVHPQAIEAIKASCHDTAAFNFTFIGNDAAAKAAGLATAPADSRCDPIFLHLLAARPPAQQFADESLRHDYRIWQLKTGLSSGGLLVFLACLLFASKQFYDAYRLSGDAQRIQAEAVAAGQRYDELAKTFPPLPVNNDTLRQVIGRYQNLERQAEPPLEFFEVLSKALETTPQVELEAITWQHGLGKGAPQPGSGDEESALVRGNIPNGTTTTPRQILATFERFLSSLRQQPGVQVTVQQQPFDVESGKALRGGSVGEGGPAAVEPRHFLIQVTRKEAG